MCWNKEVSFATFAVGTLINIFLWAGSTNVNFKGVLLVWQFALFMQLIEGFLWIENESKSKQVNNKWSRLAFFANILQPVVALVIFGFVLRKRNKVPPCVVMSVSVLATFYVYYMVKNTNLTTLQVTKDGDCHLGLAWWHKIDYSGLLFFILLCGTFLLVRPFPLALTNLVFVAIAFKLTLHFYNPNSIASLWCFFVTIIPLLLYILSRTNIPFFNYY